MEIRDFQLVDFGIHSKDTELTRFGLGFRDHSDLMIAEGDSAKEAFQTLLDDLTADGLGIADVSRAGRAVHFESPDAETPVEELLDPDDEATKDTTCAYFVGIRFNDPRDPIDVEEVDDEDSEEGEEA